MNSKNIGLTEVYNHYHDPSCSNPGIETLRALHQEIDMQVLKAYGWGEIPVAMGFGLDFLDINDDFICPAPLQARIESRDFFFPDSAGAIDFEEQLRSLGAIKNTIQWRYRWPDDVCDDVLARLLALNAERYAEEVAQGLHSKGKKKAASAAGTKRGKPAKTATSASSEQMGLGL